jgi:hypothetical protein
LTDIVPKKPIAGSGNGSTNRKSLESDSYKTLLVFFAAFLGLVIDIHLYRLGKAAWGSLLRSCALRRTGSWSTGSSPALPGGGPRVKINTTGNMSNK